MYGLSEPRADRRTACPNVSIRRSTASSRLLVPGERYLPLLRTVIEQADVRGNLVFDAQIAAVCLEHGAQTLLTEDRDFTRFTGISVLTLAAFSGT